MNGLLIALKPPGMTSHDLVAIVRGLTGAKAGHTGTLDPAAAGVMVLCVGQATRLARWIGEETKSYRAEMTLGITTDTLDAEGRLTVQACGRFVTAEAVEAALGSLVGELWLSPPAHSAVKRGGKRLYAAARRGEQVEAPPRRMVVSSCRLLRLEPARHPRVLVELDCSSGTYVRSLAAELGRLLGCGAYVSFLLRTRVGPHRLAQALTVEQLQQAARARALGAHLIPLARALPRLPLMSLDWPLARRMSQGQRLSVDGGTAMVHADLIRFVNPRGELVCLGAALPAPGGSVLIPRLVIGR